MAREPSMNEVARTRAKTTSQRRWRSEGYAHEEGGKRVSELCDGRGHWGGI